MNATCLTWIGRTVALSIAAFAAACAPTVDNHGWRVDQAAVAQIQPGVTTRDEVRRLLGSPSSLAPFGDGSWLYVSQKTETRSFYQSTVDAQDVLRVDFDEAGLVTDLEQHGLDMARAIDPADEKTRTLGNELSVVQQFVGNIGRFNSGAEGAGATSRAAGAARRGGPGSAGY